MNNEDKIECRTCPTCKKPFMWTEKVILNVGGFTSLHVRSGSVCPDCQDKMRSAINHGTNELRGIWFDDGAKNEG